MTELASLSVESVAGALGWPRADDIVSPAGSGPAMFAQLARDKIGRALARFSNDGSARLGILTPDSDSPDTEPPLALVVEFGHRVPSETLRELHRLAWNFSHSPTLITIEPDLVRVWSCCEAPSPDQPIDHYVVHTVSAETLRPDEASRLQARGARALHWINLVSGEFVAARAAKFDRDGRADQMLLANLRDIRDRLRALGLIDDDVCHDLLARVIFVQFLFDRKDADGVAALNAEKLRHLHAEGILSALHGSLQEILSDYEDSYRLFDWLNTKFNGDLFPGKGETREERAAGWAAERALVKPPHLALLAHFIAGNVELPTGQICLWPQYSFDVIPLEFISSIYETFVTERAARDGIFYTPPHLVDFVLDRVLPWAGSEWDLKILDPACGSGIFLVKTFQRLVHRWKRAHPKRQIRADVLRRLLTRNLLGVDKDPHAVRVACFSLYLAMCDEIEPRHYWTQVRFPTMRGHRLICSDFFEESVGFDTRSADDRFDLIVGNAPWGSDLVTARAKEWAQEDDHCWPIVNKDIGSLFLAKGAWLLKAGGRLALIQSASSLLFNGADTAVRFRRQLFTHHSVEAIYNLSALRFKVFKRKSHTAKMSSSPACVVIMRSAPPDADRPITYVSPSSLPSAVDEFTITIEPDNYRYIASSDAASDPFVWTALMWGTPRDLALLRRLQQYPSLASRVDGDLVRKREGIIAGDRKKLLPDLSGRRYFTAKQFPGTSLTHLDAQDVPIAAEIVADDRASTNFAAFELPQLLIKQGWQLESRRFQARLVRSSEPTGILCSQSYVTIHAPLDVLESACLAYNSMLAAYFLQLTSGRMAAYRPETTVRELLDMPLPPIAGDLTAISSPADFDTQMFAAFRLKDAERALVEDMINVTVADFRVEHDRPGARRTAGTDQKEEVLTRYSEYFIRVLKAGFGQDKGVRATIFSPPPDEPMPYRLMAFELVQNDDEQICTVSLDAPKLLAQFEALTNRQVSETGSFRSMLVKRVARIYDGHGPSPTIFLLKPDAVRYWTRTAALNDADEVAIDLFRWMSASSEHRPS